MNQLTRIAVILELEQYLKKYGFAKEVLFNKIMPTKRQFRADYFLPSFDIIIEVNGGQFSRGRHNRGGKGYENDLTKLNIAQQNGFKIFQFTYEMLARLEYKTILNF